MRTLEDLEAQRDSLGKARLFTYRAKAIASSSIPSEQQAIFSQTVPAHYKAAVPAAMFDPNEPTQDYSREFLRLSARARILPRLVGAVPLIPYFHTPVSGIIGQATFTAEGAPLPAFRYDVDQVFSQPTRLGMLLVLTNELVRSRDERGVSTVERLLNRVLIRGENTQFLSTDARVVGQNPGGILNGLTAISGSPTVTAADVAALFDSVSDGQPERPYIILSGRGALCLRSLADSDSGSIFREVDVVAGGTVGGIPVLIAPEAGSKMILVDAAMIGLSDEGVDVARSESGAIVMDDAPSAGPQAVVAAFQTNSTILRLTRFVDWALATDDAASYIELPIAGSPS